MEAKTAQINVFVSPAASSKQILLLSYSAPGIVVFDALGPDTKHLYLGCYIFNHMRKVYLQLRLTVEKMFADDI